MSDKVNGENIGDSRKDFEERVRLLFKNSLAEDSDILNYCKERAEAGDYNAMLWLARMYRDGFSIEKNESKALEWYKKSKQKSVLSRFELLAILSNQERKFEDVPEGLNIDVKRRERLFVYKFDNRCIDLLVNLFPFTHYNVVGFSYKDKTHIGYNENCDNYDKILVANVDDSSAIKRELISEGVSAEKIILVTRYLDKDKFDGDAIVCDFSSKSSKKKTWVIAPNEANGLLWLYNNFKKFRGEDISKCNYLVDTQNHFSNFMDTEGLGHYNPWDYFFKPVSQLTLQDAYNLKGVVISSWFIAPGKRIPSNLRPEISETMKKKINQEMDKIWMEGRTLGVISRGTDFVSTQPLRHGVPLDGYELIEVVEERMNSIGFANVYLSTEDQDTHDAFIEHFKDRMIAINQKRFKKEPIRNFSLYDRRLSGPFDKLIQGERYLIATHLVTKCDMVLACDGGGSNYVVDNSHVPIEIHTKGRWGFFGDNPLIVCSHNKNRVDVVNINRDEGKVGHIGKNGHILAETNQEIIIDNVSVNLEKDVKYICSFKSKEPESVSLLLSLPSENHNDMDIVLNHGYVFSVPFDVHSGTVIVKRGSEDNSEIGIQIERGTVFTDYEPPRYSWTQICIKDMDGNEFALEDVEHIDFNKCIFCAHGKEYSLDHDEANRFHNIICFKDGFLTYHKGLIQNNMTSLGEIVDPQIIAGTPKQLIRFSHTCELADNMINGAQGEIEKALCIYYYHAMNGNDQAKKKLSELYYDGEHVRRDLDAAIWWMRNISRKDSKSLNKLFDMLTERGRQEDLESAVAVIKSLAEGGDGAAMWRLSCAYRSGAGTVKDINKADIWMRRAAHKGHGTAANTLFDILWEKGTARDLEEAVSVIRMLAEKGNTKSMERLSRAYREGKGVEMNLDRASEWMRKAADKNVAWAKNELFDILWKIGTPESMKEMIAVATDFAEKGDGNAMGRLGRAYRHGKGVPQDLDKAAEWMRKAADKNVAWAKNELFDMQKIKGGVDD